MNEPRKTDEQRFYDDYYQSADLPTLNGFYLVSRGVLTYESRIYEDCAGKRVLEYGCGTGSHARRLAERGAFVQGIDISPEAIQKARASAGDLGDRVQFIVADAEGLQFPDGSFDMVCGTGILHHLDLARAVGEVKRVLRPGGRAVFYEPVAHNPLVNLYRVVTPSRHTKDEHPLRMADITSIGSQFASFHATFFGVLSIFAIPFLRLPGGMRLLRALEAIDRGLLGLRLLHPMSATVVLDGRA